jgi:hypothetical protein
MINLQLMFRNGQCINFDIDVPDDKINNLSDELSNVLREHIIYTDNVNIPNTIYCFRGSDVTAFIITKIKKK